MRSKGNIQLSRGKSSSWEASDGALNKSLYFPPNTLTLQQKFWWEAFGMGLFVMIISNIKIQYGFDFWLTAILYIGMNLCIKQSGAHYNPSMTLSNFIIKFSPTKIDPHFMWTYFKAEFVPALLAYHINFYLKGFYYPPMVSESLTQSYQIVASEFVGTFMLTLLLQKTCNSQTTWTTSDAQMQGFVIMFVFVSRRFAVLSGNSINPVTALAGAVAAMFQCQFGPIKSIHLYLIGDYCGSIAGSLFYNYVYEPALQASRRQKMGSGDQKQWYKNLKNDRVSTLSGIIRTMQLEDQEMAQFKQSDIKYKSDVFSEDNYQDQFLSIPEKNKY